MVSEERDLELAIKSYIEEKTPRTLAKLFEVAGYNYEELEPNNYRPKNSVEILSYNEKENKLEFKKVLTLMKTEPKLVYHINVTDNNAQHNFHLECSGEHKLLVRFRGEQNWYSVGYIEQTLQYEESDLELCLVLPGNFQSKQVVAGQIDSIFKLGEKRSFLDLEVEDNHNYIADGFVSHNSFFGNPETTSGGNALLFYSSMRLDVRRKQPIKEGGDDGEVLGAETQVHIVKNKCARPFKRAHFNIIYGEGIDKIADIIATAKDFGIITNAGPWYSYNGEKIACGMPATVEYFKLHPELVQEIRKMVLGKLKENPTALKDIKEDDGTEQIESNPPSENT